MPNKRLEKALNAGKLYQLGLNFIDSKPENLSLLYKINCVSKKIDYGDINGLESERSNFSQDSGSNTGSDDHDKVEILSLQFNQSQNLLAIGDSDGNIQIYDIFSAETINDSKSIYNMPIICMKWHPYSNFTSNYLYYAHVSGLIGVYDKQTLKKKTLVEEKDEISCLDFNLDGSVLASVGKDSVIRLYDSDLKSSPDLNKIITTFGADSENRSFFSSISNGFSSILSTSPSHTGRLQCVKFSNTSKDLFFTGGWDRSVKAWDKRTNKGYVDSLQGPFICGSDAIDVNDNLVLTASWVRENALELWDIRKFKRISTLPIAVSESKIENASLRDKLKLNDNKVNEYLYACKFFSTNNHQNDTNSTINTVLACGSGTQSLHLVDYEKSNGSQLVSSYFCGSALYCLDAIYSCSLISCGGVNSFSLFTGH